VQTGSASALQGAPAHAAHQDRVLIGLRP